MKLKSNVAEVAVSDVKRRPSVGEDGCLPACRHRAGQADLDAGEHGIGVDEVRVAARVERVGVSVATDVVPEGTGSRRPAALARVSRLDTCDMQGRRRTAP